MVGSETRVISVGYSDLAGFPLLAGRGGFLLRSTTRGYLSVTWIAPAVPTVLLRGTPDVRGLASLYFLLALNPALAVSPILASIRHSDLSMSSEASRGKTHYSPPNQEGGSRDGPLRPSSLSVCGYSPMRLPSWGLWLRRMGGRPRVRRRESRPRLLRLVR